MKKLEQIKQESKEIKDKIDHTEEKLRQLKNQEKKILKQDIIKRRKERTCIECWLSSRITLRRFAPT